MEHHNDGQLPMFQDYINGPQERNYWKSFLQGHSEVEQLINANDHHTFVLLKRDYLY